jgi:hypothetical protein
MLEASDGLMKLRPVTFHYKAPYDDGTHVLQYGLIAEEVAKVYPDMVQFGQDGKPLALRYQFLDALLLNEVQKQHGANESQRATLEAQQAKIATLESRLQEQAAMIARLAARLAEIESGGATSPR